MIRFDVVTLFPEMFAAVTASGITRKALEAVFSSLSRGARITSVPSLR